MHVQNGFKSEVRFCARGLGSQHTFLVSWTIVWVCIFAHVCTTPRRGGKRSGVSPLSGEPTLSWRLRETRPKFFPASQRRGLVIIHVGKQKLRLQQIGRCIRSPLCRQTNPFLLKSTCHSLNYVDLWESSYPNAATAVRQEIQARIELLCMYLN
jgi:hypothetical protein